MAIQQVNVYSFTIQLNSKHKSNEHIGTQILAAGATAAAAQSVVQQQFGNDLATISGGLVKEQGVYTTLS